MMRATKPQTCIEEDRGYRSLCCIWQGGISGKYGWMPGTRTFAHRAIWIRERGPIPKGFVIHHLCGETMCVRLSHMILMTKREHRFIHPESGRRSRLTRDQIEDIRLSPLSLRKIAEKHGITFAYASKIRRGESLKNH